MTKTRDSIVDLIWRSKDPFAGFPDNLYEYDAQGWYSNHWYLTESIPDLGATPIIVEVGVWKGGSVITMAQRLRELQADGVVIAIDTWLGAWDHWISDEWFSQLSVSQGRPAIQNKFMSNIVREGLTGFVVPMPLDSLNAANVFRHLRITPNQIHLDGGHDYEAVISDIRSWWPMLSGGGILIGDDYDGVLWPEVKRAFDDFFSDIPNITIQHDANKCRIMKP